MAIKYGGNERGGSMKVSGLKELEDAMRKDLPTAVNRRALIGAMRASAKPMMQSAKDNVPKGGSGALAESIGLRTVRNRGNNKFFAQVHLAPMSGNLLAWARYMIHYGKKINLVSKKTGRINASSLGRIRHGHLVEFGFRHTSGKQVPARPFLRKAFDQQYLSYINSFKGDLKIRIENAAKKAKKVKRMKYGVAIK